jgi:proline iminopeptidase
VDGLYPQTEPHASGMLDVGEGNSLYWETCGSQGGKPVVVLHGGPGSGCIPEYREFFDPRAYRAVLFDQRNCGRSTPHARDLDVDLAPNTTHHLVRDLERLREHLGVDRWLVFGGSWGSTLSLAYAEAHPERVTELVLWGVTTGRHCEFDWLFRGGVAKLFPEQWDRLVASLPERLRGEDVPAAFNRLLEDPNEVVRRRAAEAWCRWESATPKWPPTDELSPRFRDQDFAYAFARIVTHYVSHDAWLEDGALISGAGSLAAIPGILVNGRFDLQAPIEHAWTLKKAWPRAELVIVDGSGHSPMAGELQLQITGALDRFAD